jgi:hypothetical protein
VKYGELIKLYFERSSATVSYWTAYAVGLAAVIAYLAAKSQVHCKDRIALFVGFIFFSELNLIGLVSVSNQRQAVFDVMNAFAEKNQHPEDIELRMAERLRGNLERTLRPFAKWKVISLHLLADAVSALGIWLLS